MIFYFKFMLEFVRELLRAIIHRGVFYVNFGLDGVVLKWRDCEVSVKFGVGSITKRSIKFPMGMELRVWKKETHKN